MTSEVTREQILSAFPLTQQLLRDGLKLHGTGRERTCRCPFHDDHTPSMSVNVVNQCFMCFVCNVGGSIVDYLSRKEARSAEDIFRELAEEYRRSHNGNGHHNGNGNGHVSGEIVATYSYRDAMGNEVYQSLRIEPGAGGRKKEFKQRHRRSGQWIWNMDGIERVLYRLPEVLAAGDETVWVVEGEGKALKLAELGFIATCNVGGAGKWMDGYSSALEGKDVVICGDNDAPGKAHVQKVMESLDGKAKRLRIATIPQPYNDVADYVAATPHNQIKEALQQLLRRAAVIVQGSSVPLLSAVEMEDRLKALMQNTDGESYSFAQWLPTFGWKIRPRVPGDVICFVASTGCGKTAILQNMAFRCPLPTVMFQMELADALTWQRFVSGAMGMHQDEVWDAYKAGTPPDWRNDYKNGQLDNIYTCCLSGLTVLQMETIIKRSELKIGRRPVLVQIDYAQLMKGNGKGRYEQMTNVMSDLKSMAKNCGVVVVVASQVMRKGEVVEIGLEDGKDSGQIENSAGLHIGVWRGKDEDAQGNNELLWMRVNKNTNGRNGLKIPCNFDPARMLITERIEPPSDP